MLKRRLLNIVVFTLIMSLIFSCVAFFSACADKDAIGNKQNTEQSGDTSETTPDGNEGAPDDNEIAVASVSLSQTSLYLEIGESYTLVATVLPDNATDKSVTWSSSEPSVATVENGKVTAVSGGTTTITATTSNGKKVTCNVTVNEAAPEIIDVTSISLNQTSLTLEIGESQTLTATVLPSNATDKSVTWSSSDNSVATVSGGRVTAVDSGIATIIATTNNGKTATCSVTVNEPLPEIIEATSISLSQTSLTLEVDESYTLTATVLPDNATDKSVAWMSVNENVAKVVNGTIYAIGSGKTTIYATTSNNLNATCEVIVNRNIPLQFIQLNGGKDINMLIGEQTTTTCTGYPANTTDSVKINVSNNGIIEVRIVDGVIYIDAVGSGSSKLTATSSSGLSVSINVNVYQYDCILPQTPFTLRNYDYDYFTLYYANITSVEGSFSTYDHILYGQCIALELKIEGKITEKLYDPPKNFKITYEILNEESDVVASGVLQTGTIYKYSDFVIETSIYITGSFKSGNYTLELGDYQYDYIIGW